MTTQYSVTQALMKWEEKQNANKIGCIKKYLNVAISKPILSATVGHIFTPWKIKRIETQNTKKKINQSSKITDDKTEN